MRTRRFGRTDLDMPILSCGGMRYQYKWQDKPLSEVPPDNQRNLEATVRRALELGIVHIETARGYGSSERQLGEILPQLPRNELIVQTKISPKADPKQFVDEFNDSLARLKLDSVDLLALHGVNDRQVLDWSIRDGGCFEAAQELRRQGKTRFVGFSTHAPLDVILDAIRFGDAAVGRGFDYVNLHWYYIFQHNWPAIVEATQRDMGVFIISPSDKGGKLYQPPPRLVELCQPSSPMVFNDLFCLRRPEVHTISVGAARPTDFDEHMRAVELLDQADALLAPVIDRLEQAMYEAIGISDPEAIFEGLPPWEECPRKLNLRVMLWLFNLASGWGLVEYGKMRFNMLGNGGHWFPGAKPAEFWALGDGELEAAVAKSPWAGQIPERLEQAVRLLSAEAVKRQSQSD